MKKIIFNLLTFLGQKIRGFYFLLKTNFNYHSTVLSSLFIVFIALGFECQLFAAGALQASVGPGFDPRVDQPKIVHGFEELKTKDPSLTGEGVKVALVDTSIDKDHSRFQGRVEGCNADSSKYLELEAVDKDHGTHVAGIIAAQTNREHYSDAGVAPGVTILSTRTKKVETIASMIKTAAESDANIINISYGTQGSHYFESIDETTQDAAINAACAGKLIVKSAGNEGKEALGSPYLESLYRLADRINSNSNIDGAMIIVMNAQKTRSGAKKLCLSSNMPAKGVVGAQHSLCAVGDKIRSTVDGGAFEEKTGTSMSAPYVSGAAALLMQAYPDASAKDIAKALLNTAILPNDVVTGSSTHTKVGHLFEQYLGTDVVQRIGRKLGYRYDEAKKMALESPTAFGRGYLNVFKAHKALASKEKKDVKSRGSDLLEAVERNDLEVLEGELSKLDARTSHECNAALIYTANAGHLEAMKLILKKANVNYADENGKTALMIAAIKGHIEFVKVLLCNKKTNINQTDKNGMTALAHAMRTDHPEVAELIRNNALLEAAEHNNLDALKSLVADGTDVNYADENGKTALMIAAIKGHIEIVKELLCNEKIDLTQKDGEGHTALDYAMEEKHTEVAELIQRSKNNALQKAAGCNNLDTLRSLIADGADVNYVNPSWTALIHAAEKGHIEIVKVLLACEKINVDLEDIHGNTALFYAQYGRGGKMEIVELIEEHKKSVEGA